MPSQVAFQISLERGAPQLGSLGFGNHFLEIQKVDKIVNERAARAMGIDEQGQLTVLIRCCCQGGGKGVADIRSAATIYVFPKLL